MKLTAFILLSTCLAASANGHTQGVTLSLRNVSIEKAFAEIKKQTGYEFLYGSKALEVARPVSIDVKNGSLEQVLNQCFKDQPLTWAIVDKTIIVKPGEGSGHSGLDPETFSQLPPPIDIHGRILNEKGEPVIASVQVKGTNKGTTTNDNGEFELKGVDENATLVISGVSIETFEMKVNGRADLVLNAKVKTVAGEEVKIISTGYQQLPKERATGSFDQINNELLNRRVSTNILDRLEGVASGVRFQTNIPRFSTESPINVRGKSTIFSNTSPLIIVDNFPYDGDINNINPNDVESITILKDAAAASIWGAYSSNGVIVITTKKGQLNQPLRIELNSSITIGHKPDLFYDPNFISAPDFITLEQFLFQNGQYNANLNNTTNRPVISPVVEILAKRKAGVITSTDSANQIDALKNIDVRNDFERYFYRNSRYQQHSISLNGGGNRATYRFSFGYDKNLYSLINNTYDRFSINDYNTFYPIPQFQLSTGISYIYSSSLNATQNSSSDFSPAMSIGNINLYPYAQLVDGNGNALTISKDYRNSFIDTTGGGKLLDWHYRPRQELLLANNKTQISDLKFNPSIKYTLWKGLNVQIKYQYERQIGGNNNLHDSASYFTRSLINLYSQISGNAVTRQIPIGDIMDQGNTELISKRLRTQIDFDKTFSSAHNIVGLVGIETGETKVKSTANRFYGYDENNAANNSALDYKTFFPTYNNLASSLRIPFVNSVLGTTSETVSYFSNGAYTYKNRYSLSASGRIDQANIFGVDFNNKSVPLWSVGGAWKISKEQFYRAHSIPYLNLRITYGYNGNVNTSAAALLTATYNSIATVFGTFQGTVNNPPNANLQWEKIGMLNVAVDFRVKNFLDGTVELYRKSGKNLIGSLPVAPSTGFTSFVANRANMNGKGADVTLNCNNLDRNFKWSTNYLFSYTSDKVTDYDIKATTSLAAQNAGFTSTIVPIIGKPVYSIFSYRWAGLDPSTGDPMGYLGKQISKDYTSIINNTPIDSLIYHGSALPKFFGAIRNNFSYKGFSLSVNITYKLGYYFRANSVNYGALYSSYSGAHNDFSKRWQKPGDEKFTNVPSMIYPVSSNDPRDFFYLYSEVLVHRGDHIRLQDIQLQYDILKKRLSKLPLDKIQLYIYANNLGIIWKADKDGLDPDYLTGYPNPQTFAFGVKISL